MNPMSWRKTYANQFWPIRNISCGFRLTILRKMRHDVVIAPGAKRWCFVPNPSYYPSATYSPTDSIDSPQP